MQCFSHGTSLDTANAKKFQERLSCFDGFGANVSASRLCGNTA
jgi:hypothetical protein